MKTRTKTVKQQTSRPFAYAWPHIPVSQRVFSDGEKKNYVRTNTNVPLDVHNFFVGIRPRKGTYVDMVSLLLEALKRECCRRGITDMTKQAEFERLVANCKIVEETNGN